MEFAKHFGTIQILRTSRNSLIALSQGRCFLFFFLNKRIEGSMCFLRTFVNSPENDATSSLSLTRLLILVSFGDTMAKSVLSMGSRTEIFGSNLQKTQLINLYIELQLVELLLP